MSKYRIEERDRGTNKVLVTRRRGLYGPLDTPEQAHEQFFQEVRSYPGRYDVDSRYRLVLLGPGA
jgi:hypothetical protein